MSSANGYTFVDDSEMSVCEKIKKYFEKKTTEAPIYLNESTSDSSMDSFSHLDESFVEILKSNQHVTLIRNSKKEKEATMNTDQVSNIQCQNSTTEPQDTPRPIIRSDDSFKCEGVDLWNLVSDESFLEAERQCQSPIDNEQNDTTMLFDVEEPTFLNESSVFESPKLMLSPMKQVAMRRPSTIMEESTIRSINSSDECSGVGIGSSLSLKQSVKQVVDKSTKLPSYRPSMVNVFPSKSRIGFYDSMDVMTSSCTSSEPEPEPKRNSLGKENSERLISFDDSFDVADKSPTDPTPKLTVLGKRDSVCLISFVDSVDDESSTNVSVDQTQNDSSLMDNGQPDQFNDTLEAVDYYMRQGKKILDKTACSTSILQPLVTFSPRNQSNSLLRKALATRHLMSIHSDNILDKKHF